MPSTSSPISFAHAQVASFSHKRPPGHPELVAAQQNLAALVIEKHVRKALAGKPKLTDEQVRRITELLTAAP
jgi:hypothetical protein